MGSPSGPESAVRSSSVGAKPGATRRVRGVAGKVGWDAGRRSRHGRPVACGRARRWRRAVAEHHQAADEHHQRREQSLGATAAAGDRDKTATAPRSGVLSFISERLGLTGVPSRRLRRARDVAEVRIGRRFGLTRVGTRRRLGSHAAGGRRARADVPPVVVPVAGWRRWLVVHDLCVRGNRLHCRGVVGERMDGDPGGSSEHRSADEQHDLLAALQIRPGVRVLGEHHAVLLGVRELDALRGRAQPDCAHLRDRRRRREPHDVAEMHHPSTRWLVRSLRPSAV